MLGLHRGSLNGLLKGQGGGVLTNYVGDLDLCLNQLLTPPPNTKLMELRLENFTSVLPHTLAPLILHVHDAVQYHPHIHSRPPLSCSHLCPRKKFFGLSYANQLKPLQIPPHPALYHVLCTLPHSVDEVVLHAAATMGTSYKTP